MTRVYSPAEALQAGREHARARGDKPSPVQAARLAALLRPYRHLIWPEDEVKNAS